MTFSSTIEEVNSTRRKFKISVPAASPLNWLFRSCDRNSKDRQKFVSFRKGQSTTSLNS